MTLPTVFAIAGCVGILISIFGGGIRAKQIEIDRISKQTRIASGLIGALLIVLAIWLSFPSPLSIFSPEKTVESSLTQTSTDTPDSTGTSPTDTPSPSTGKKSPVTVNLPYMPDESGSVTEYGHIGTGYSHPPQAGDLNNNEPIRGFLSFDLGVIPDGAVIHSAKIILPESIEVLGEPIPSFGSLKFEALYYGLTLVPEAYDSSSYLVIQDTYGKPSDIGVTTAIEMGLKLEYRRFQVRFKFAYRTNNDDKADEFIINEDPILEVVYDLP